MRTLVEVVFKQGPEVVYRVPGLKLFGTSEEMRSALTLSGDQVIVAEQVLETLTGYRVHIQEVEV